jgi:hypothetical protein
MEVLACIPELPGPDASVAQAAVSEPLRPAQEPLRPIATAGAAVPVDADEEDEGAAAVPAPRRGVARQSRSSGFFSPSIIALAVMAAVVWAAAWRNDHLRLEAARLQRPERLAQALPATAGGQRSVKP